MVKKILQIRGKMYGMIKKSTKSSKKRSADYRHSKAGAVLRPESGAQDKFPESKHLPPRAYRHDSSLSPELSWDNSDARKEGENLIDDILSADDLDNAQEAARKLKKIQKPFLNWSGKAEGAEMQVPSLPLFVHERLSTKAILQTLERHKRDRQSALDLFGEGKKTIGDAIAGAYEHMNGWQNRLIFGDSLQIMNSLLSYEHMGRKVQMIYMDPPYGVKFDSNFMPFVRKKSGGGGMEASRASPRWCRHIATHGRWAFTRGLLTYVTGSCWHVKCWLRRDPYFFKFLTTMYMSRVASWTKFSGQKTL